MTHFHHSAKATRELLAYQESQNVKRPLHLVQDVVTRWNSQLGMMQRLLKLRVAVITVLHNEDVTKKSDRKQLELTDTTWKVGNYEFRKRKIISLSNNHTYLIIKLN